MGFIWFWLVAIMLAAYVVLDGFSFFSSALFAIFSGAALANVIRGVPLQEDGYFFLPLWTNWRIGPQPGILDWYTVIGGVVALVALAVHGALYLAVKTEADLQGRSRTVARRLWMLLLVLTIVSLPASMIARTDTLANYRAYPIAFLVPVAVLLALLGMIQFCGTGADLNACACSCVYLTVMLVGAAIGLYPRLLPSTTGPRYDITIDQALS